MTSKAGNVLRALGDWRVEYGVPMSDPAHRAREIHRWSDPACGLSVFKVNDQAGDVIRLRLGDDLVVDVKSDRTISAHPSEGYCDQSLHHVLTDLILPRLIAVGGALVLHAGAVRSGGSAIMLMGLSGRGKSTLVSSFHQAGYGLLGDDAMIVSPAATPPAVRPIYPSLRLLPDSIEAIMPGVASTERVAQYSTKQRIDVTSKGDEFDWPLPIAAIFALAAPDDRDAISVRRTSVADTCMSLVENSFALDPSDTEQARQRMEQASALACAVPAFEITYPRDYARLPEVRQAILDQIALLEVA